ncbi:hypothetical protein BpHYR1_052319 [Brachionus plicatilis]|uniref:Uncharacterized protein n=1 Tax=Brachionus plicatilis TaxID=10195 RepID=A0A3M7T3B8_BRAPC|nr:hypothetical protein BpHYR1_052319 [Brachionus plicatilis]
MSLSIPVDNGEAFISFCSTFWGLSNGSDLTQNIKIFIRIKEIIKIEDNQKNHQIIFLVK